MTKQINESEKYEGEQKNDIKTGQGKGKFYKRNVGKYICEYNNDLMEGKGVLYYINNLYT